MPPIRDVLAIAAENVVGPVTGARHAGAIAFGLISGNITANTGDAFAVTWGDVASTPGATAGLPAV